MTLGPSGLAWTLSAKKTILLWGSQPFSSENPLRTLKTFCVPSDNNFPYPRIPNIIICIPLCYNLQTLELFTYPLGLKYPRLRNPALMGQLFPFTPSKSVYHFYQAFCPARASKFNRRRNEPSNCVNFQQLTI